jgi:hypothetical protein
MRTATAIAFKEWASIVKALSAGEQVLILRKGGIHEKGKKFSVLHESFFLFPTYEHQNPEDLNPVGQKFLGVVKSTSPLTDSSQVTLEYFAEVKDSLWIDDFEKLLKLSDFHVWSENALRKRFQWGRDQGVYALVVRVFRLPEPQILSNLPKYGGCRSWVELENPVSFSELEPVLKDQEFSAKLGALQRILAG